MDILTGEIVTTTDENSEWYQALVEDCKAIIVEAVFNSRWALVEGYHQLGERIVNEVNLDRKEIYGKKILQQVGKSLGISITTLYYAVQFYEKYPDLSLVPEGKNITWKKIITKYLPKGNLGYAEPKPLEGRYRIIYADPPWKYGDAMIIKGYKVSAEMNYPVMTIEELCDLPIKDIAEDDSVLFLWTTSPILEEAFDVIHAWGFEYKTSFVWDKVDHNFGHYNSVRHEFLLVCTRGSCLPDNPKLYDSVQSIQKNGHSSKPIEFRKIIDDLYKEGERIELFARSVADGWDTWGNEYAVN